TILDHYRRLDAAFAAGRIRPSGGLAPLDHLICYAVKANSNRAILSLFAKEGAGFDIVSGGELFRVVAAGGDPAKCTFAGVGKSREEIEYALEQRVYSFNVESEAELDYIEQIAASKRARAPVALRVNPDVDVATHEYISTGKSENKFGIALDHAAAARRENENSARAWAIAGRERRCFAHARPLPQANRPEKIRNCRCRNERPDSPGALP